jgi:hypothetical protein
MTRKSLTDNFHAIVIVPHGKQMQVKAAAEILPWEKCLQKGLQIKLVCVVGDVV